MEEEKFTQTKNSEAGEEPNSVLINAVSSYRQPIVTLLKGILSFICYGPGVLGFLWLIGRILKR